MTPMDSRPGRKGVRRRLPRTRFDLWALLFAALGFLGGCGTTDPLPRGVIQGIVLIEGNALSGVSVELTGPLNRTLTTDLSGRFRFEELQAGAYVVSVRGTPPDAAFPAISRSAVISDGATLTVDFQGSFIRTASISGQVTSGGRGVSGVRVGLRGVASLSTLTDGSGNFSFPGLRAGAYEVEISAFPSFLLFQSTRTSVELATGQDRVLTFEGRSQVTASAIIRGLVRRLPSGATEPVDLQDVRGSVELVVSLDRGEDTLDSLVVFLGDQRVAGQVFVQGASGSPEASAGSGSPIDLVFPIHTSAFDPATGTPRFLNGERGLIVRLATREAGPTAWTARATLQLRNPDTFVASVQGSRGPEEDLEGRAWWGGDLSVRLLPVVFSVGRQVTSAVLEWRPPGGEDAARVTVIGDPPFVAVFPENPGLPGSLSDYQTTHPLGDEIRVVSGRYSNGQAIEGLPIRVASGIRLDRVPPEPTEFRLLGSGGGRDCCLQNWVGSNYLFASGLNALRDVGVGRARVAIHAGEAGASDAEILARPPVQRGEDLPASSSNTAYRALAVLSDPLGNRRILSLTPNEANPLANPRGAVFGVDRTSPSAGLDPDGAGLRSTAVNPSPGSNWVWVGEAGPSGFGALPVRSNVRLFAPGVTGDARCVVPGPGDCEPVEGTAVRRVPEGQSGYLLLQGWMVSRAGNRSPPVEARVLWDRTSPQVSPTMIPTELQGGVVRSFAATARDDIDLHLGQVRLRFGPAGGITLPFAPPAQLGTPFSLDLSPEGAFSIRFPFVVGIEAAPEGIPNGSLLPATAVETEAVDAAGNRATAQSLLPSPGALPLRGFGVGERGPNGIVRWELATSVSEVCGQAEGCGAEVPRSMTVTGRATGGSASFARPFTAVHLVGEQGGVWRWIGNLSGGNLSQTDSGAAWSWSLSWAPQEGPWGGVRLALVGVDEAGMALLSPPVTVQVRGGP